MDRLVEEAKQKPKILEGIVSINIFRAATRIQPTFIPKKNRAIDRIKNDGIIEKMLRRMIKAFDQRITFFLPKVVTNSPPIKLPNATPIKQAAFIIALSLSINL